MAPARQTLSATDLAAGLQRLDGWRVLRGKLHREYRFPSFVEAFGFMASVAVVAEGMDHHPHWTNVYVTVRVDLMTHDAGGITARDLALAARMDQLARDRARS